jgi:hypothetical protein
MIKKDHDQFLMNLVRYFQELIKIRLPIPQHLRSNPIGERYMALKNYTYRELYAYTKCNKTN